MKKRDRDMLILAVLAFFLFRKKDAPAPVPVVVAPSTPQPVGPVTSTLTQPDGTQITVERAKPGGGPLNFADPAANAPASATVP